jgi:cytosine deaminase
LADLAAKYGGLLGGATDTLSRGADGTHMELDRALDRMFELAGERGLDVDLHVDQTQDLSAFTIPNIARSKPKTGFKGRVVCGHLVNLSLQPPELIDSTLALAREADLAFVSMPTPMMYLMDRKKDRTPRWRGVTAAKEILAAGLPLAVGGDNCRDAWFPYGDRPIRLRQGRYGTARQYGSFFRPPLGGLFMCAQDGRTPAGASPAVG